MYVKELIEVLLRYTMMVGTRFLLFDSESLLLV